MKIYYINMFRIYKSHIFNLELTLVITVLTKYLGIKNINIKYPFIMINVPIEKRRECLRRIYAALNSSIIASRYTKEKIKDIAITSEYDCCENSRNEAEYHAGIVKIIQKILNIEKNTMSYEPKEHIPISHSPTNVKKTFAEKGYASRNYFNPLFGSSQQISFPKATQFFEFGNNHPQKNYQYSNKDVKVQTMSSNSSRAASIDEQTYRDFQNKMFSGQPHLYSYGNMAFKNSNIPMVNDLEYLQACKEANKKTFIGRNFNMYTNNSPQPPVSRYNHFYNETYHSPKNDQFKSPKDDSIQTSFLKINEPATQNANHSIHKDSPNFSSRNVRAGNDLQEYAPIKSTNLIGNVRFQTYNSLDNNLLGNVNQNQEEVSEKIITYDISKKPSIHDIKYDFDEILQNLNSDSRWKELLPENNEKKIIEKKLNEFDKYFKKIEVYKRKCPESLLESKTLEKINNARKLVVWQMNHIKNEKYFFEISFLNALMSKVEEYCTEFQQELIKANTNERYAFSFSKICLQIAKAFKEAKDKDPGFVFKVKY